MPEKKESVLNGERVAELWTAVKTALAGKANLSDLDGYTTPDAVATAIASALTNYATNAGVQTAIATALANYMTTSEVNDAIASAVVAVDLTGYWAKDELTIMTAAELQAILV